jgi:hypothetical protein
MGQPFVKDDKQTVEKMLAAKKAELHGYSFLVVGEGIEKKQSDFRGGSGRDDKDSGVTMAAAPAKPAEPAYHPAYPRILLKLSGEALMGNDSFGINRETVDRIVAQVKEVSDLGVQIGIVIGGGNIFRGVSQGAAAWTAPRPTTWACSRPSSTRSRCRTR